MLVEHFVERFNRELGKRIEGLTPEALAALKDYPWPGNVRELQNVIERSVALMESGPIGLNDLPTDLLLPDLEARTGFMERLRAREQCHRTLEASEELSEEDDSALRSYYSVGLADREMIESAQSYASQVPDEHEPAREVDASEVEGQVRQIDERPPGERAREADESDQEEKGEEHRKGRKATAADVLGEVEDDSADKSEDEEGA